jgi:hypothetical protein
MNPFAVNAVSFAGRKPVTEDRRSHHSHRLAEKLVRRANAGDTVTVVSGDPSGNGPVQFKLSHTPKSPTASKPRYSDVFVTVYEPDHLKDYGCSTVRVSTVGSGSNAGKDHWADFYVKDHRLSASSIDTSVKPGHSAADMRASHDVKGLLAPVNHLIRRVREVIQPSAAKN